MGTYLPVVQSFSRFFASFYIGKISNQQLTGKGSRLSQLVLSSSSLITCVY